MILHQRELEDGREITVVQMIFTRRICIGPAGELCFDDGWCYPNDLGALFVVAAAIAWDGEDDPPVGWVKHIGSGRRRKNGDPNQEWVEH